MNQTADQILQLLNEQLKIANNSPLKHQCMWRRHEVISDLINKIYEREDILDSIAPSQPIHPFTD